MQWKFRSEWVPWVNRYKVSSASSEGALPSGTQEEDMWQALQEVLFESSAGDVKKMKRSEYEERKDNENLELVIDTSENGDCVAPPRPPEEMTDDSPHEGNSERGNSPESAIAGDDAATSETPPDVVQDNAAIPDGATSDAPGDVVRVKKPISQNWLHPFSLIFARFGPFADHQDPYLDLKLSDGPIEDADDSASFVPTSEGGQGCSRKR